MLAALGAALLAFSAPASGEDLTADFTWSPREPDPGEQVTFTSTGVGTQSYAWDLDGDGEFDDRSGAQVTYSFAEPGGHKVKLRVTGADGHTAERERTVQVTTGLKSSFTWSPAAPTTADQVTFTSTSTIIAGTITAYNWDLNGDRKFDDAKGPSVTRTFTEPGDHQVGLRVTDDTGAKATSFETVAVTTPSAAAPAPAQPPASGEPAPASAPAPAPTQTSTGQQWLSPFPSVRIRGIATRGGVHLSLFAIRAPVETRVKLRCKGTRCPGRVRSYLMKSERLRLRGLERFLTAGTRVEVFIWKPGLVGKYTRFAMRRARPPVRVDRCLYPGGKWPGRCPS